MKVNYEEKTVVTQQPEAHQMKVIKRDGRHVDFDEQKINEALIKAEKKIHGSLSPLTYEKSNDCRLGCPRNQKPVC